MVNSCVEAQTGLEMKAVVQDTYGGPEELQIEEIPTPAPGPEDILVQVHAVPVTTADWRFRAAAFPRGMRLLGRLVAGLFRPRNRVPGLGFSGRVVAVGSAVQRFAVGDEVFGTHRSTLAEYLVVPQSATIVAKPASLTHAEAVALPFGAITAVDFVRDRAKVRPGERVLVIGASGDCGVQVVQMAKHLGAEVTAVCSARNFELVRSLGADHVIDYNKQDPRESGQTWDVILDTVHKSTFAEWRTSLSASGRHVFIEGGLLEMIQSLTHKLRRGPRVVGGVALDTPEALRGVVALYEAGVLRPVLGRRFAFEDIGQAHRLVESRHRSGAVVVEVRPTTESSGSRLQRAG